MISTDGFFYILHNRAPWLSQVPGEEAGKMTIAGIDSDGDCVRDDIENYIATLLPAVEDSQGRKHLFAYAKWLGLFLKDDLIEEEAKELANLLYIASECAHQALGDTSATTDTLETIFAKFHNTSLRSYKFLENNTLLSGWTTREEVTVSCE